MMTPKKAKIKKLNPGTERVGSSSKTILLFGSKKRKKVKVDNASAKGLSKLGQLKQQAARLKSQKRR